jgi:hypothetical protein
MTIELPIDFGADARRRGANCPYVLTDRATECDLTPGTVVYGSNNAIEESFAEGQVVRMVLFGFTKPHGYAACLDRDGEWWLVHPEALSTEAPT